MTQTTLGQPGQHQFGAGQSPRVCVDVDTDRTTSTAGKQFKNRASPATHIEQVANGCSHRQLDQCLVNRTICQADIIFPGCLTHTLAT